MTDAEQTPSQDLAIPVGLPLGSGRETAKTQVSGVLGELRGTNTPVNPPSPSAGRKVRTYERIGKRRIERIEDSLSSRDEQILFLLHQHRYLTTAHLQILLFSEHVSDDSGARTARRVLARLKRDDIIRSLQRRIGGVRAGSGATVWQLAPAGARLLRSDGHLHRTHEPSLRFLHHCLAVADVRIEIESLKRSQFAEAVPIEIEPDCWRRYSGPGGEPRWLQPDLFARIQTPQFEDRWFIEVDLGTESIPTLLRKCAAYEAYRKSGQEQSSAGVFPLVLWVFVSSKRGESFRQTVARSRRLTPALYRVTTLPETAVALQGAPS